MTIIWKNVVSATDHMPPYSVYISTTAAPIRMPCACVIWPSDSTLNTSPSAVICADTQPR